MLFLAALSPISGALRLGGSGGWAYWMNGTQSVFSPDIVSMLAVEQVNSTGKIDSAELFAQAFNVSNLQAIPDMPPDVVAAFVNPRLYVAVYGVEPASGTWAGAFAVKNETGSVVDASALMGTARSRPSGDLELTGSDGTPVVAVSGCLTGSQLSFTMKSKKGIIPTGDAPQDNLSYIVTVSHSVAVGRGRQESGGGA
ncbi:hypothetical protein ABPG75_008587 [Micractinium tetrahymenae]